MKTAIVILGSANDREGNLSQIALERCEQAWIEYQQVPEAKIIPTGGWGKHFNTTHKPHGEYIKDYLVKQKGIALDAFLECVESSNTIEDARLCRPVVERHGISHLIVVTSDFHIPRARFLFDWEFQGYKLTYSPAKTCLPEDKIIRLKEHEKKALDELRKNYIAVEVI